MPFPNEHSARLVAPGGFDEFRRSNDFLAPGIDAIFGIKVDGDDRTSTLQAIRFDKEKFTVAQARAWLRDHDFEPILFEPASEEVQESVSDPGDTVKFSERFSDWAANCIKENEEYNKKLQEAGLAMKADGSCPSGYPVKKRDSETGEMRCFKRMSEQEEGFPRNELGGTVQDALQAVAQMGRKFTKDEARYVQPAPSADVVCGACRFYLRHPESEIGRCQVVEGDIPWFGTSALYISATAEAAAVFNTKQEAPENAETYAP